MCAAVMSVCVCVCVARSIISVAMEANKSKNISREKVIQSASFLAQVMAREFFVTPVRQLQIL